MSHVDPDLLALIALGESAATDDDLAHIAECPECAATIRELSEVSAVGRSTTDIGVLVRPSDRVWDAIAAEVQAAEIRPRSSGRRWLLVGAAAVVVGVLAVGGVFGWNALHPSSPSTLASATLRALPAWDGASGSALVVKLADGERQVRVRLAVQSTNTDFHEVWLMTADLKHLVSLGVVAGQTASFVVPAGVDLARYDVVDISDEPHDGNPHHSGNSIVRGKLE